MQDYINLALNDFRRVFSRQRSWLLFSAIVLGFMAAPEMIGVTFKYAFISQRSALGYFYAAKSAGANLYLAG